MVRARLHFKVVGLCAFVLGMMAFTTNAAQAAVPAFMVNGADVTSTLLPRLKAVLENETASLLTTILGIPVKTLCKTLTFTSTLGASGVVNLGTVTFGGCATYLKGSATASAPCLPSTAGVKDVISSSKGNGVIALPLANVPETLIKADEEGKPLLTVESTEECAIGQKISITGEILLKDCENKASTELVTHLVEVDNFHSGLKAAGQAVTIDGSANVSLDGEHTGLKWSSLAA